MAGLSTAVVAAVATGDFAVLNSVVWIALLLAAALVVDAHTFRSAYGHNQRQHER